MSRGRRLNTLLAVLLLSAAGLATSTLAQGTAFDDGAPNSSAGGPLRNFFRNMTGRGVPSSSDDRHEPAPKVQSPLNSAARAPASKSGSQSAFTKQPSPAAKSGAPQGKPSYSPLFGKQKSQPKTGYSAPANRTPPSNLSSTTLNSKQRTTSSSEAIAPHGATRSHLDLVEVAAQACACHPDAKRTLIAALNDSAEDVRFNAVQAIIVHAQMRCERCDRALCRDEVIAKMVAEIAFGRDASGAWHERSEMVRNSAREALRASHKVRADAVSRSEAPTNLPDLVEDEPAEPVAPQAGNTLRSRLLSGGGLFRPKPSEANVEEPAEKDAASRRFFPWPKSDSSRSGVGFIKQKPDETTFGDEPATSNTPEDSIPPAFNPLTPNTPEDDALLNKPVAPGANPSSRRRASVVDEPIEPPAPSPMPIEPVPAETPTPKSTTSILGPIAPSSEAELPRVQHLTPDGKATSRRLKPSDDEAPSGSVSGVSLNPDNGPSTVDRALPSTTSSVETKTPMPSTPPGDPRPETVGAINLLRSGSAKSAPATTNGESKPPSAPATPETPTAPVTESPGVGPKLGTPHAKGEARGDERTAARPELNRKTGVVWIVD